MLKRTLTTLAGVAALATAVAASAADESCSYKGTVYSEGSAVCQAGREFRCDDGEWESLGATCREGLDSGKTCDFRGSKYGAGSASCQAGMQYRCDDGTWKSLGATCAADAPQPPAAAPLARTCMIDGSTVASQSTICKSGTTFLCADGQWTNLGTACR